MRDLIHHRCTVRKSSQHLRAFWNSLWKHPTFRKGELASELGAVQLRSWIESCEMWSLGADTESC